jgi:exosome complex component RRP45
MRPPSPSIPEKEFLFSALKESQRLDGRLPLEMRTPVLTFGPDLGWVECAFGKTRFVVGHFFRYQRSLIVFLILSQCPCSG